MDDLKDIVWCLVYALRYSSTLSTAGANLQADDAVRSMKPTHRKANTLAEQARRMHEEHLRVYAERHAEPVAVPPAETNQP